MYNIHVTVNKYFRVLAQALKKALGYIRQWNILFIGHIFYSNSFIVFLGVLDTSAMVLFSSLDTFSNSFVVFLGDLDTPSNGISGKHLHALCDVVNLIK